MNTKEMIAVMQAYEDGKQIEVLSEGEWIDQYLPPWNWQHNKYRIKATKKPVDLSVLTDSGIDCEFWNAREDLKQYGPLDEMFNSRYPYANHIDAFEYCRPRMNHIHAWQGGECPLPEGFIVRPIYRDKEAGCWKHECTKLSWSHRGDQVDIISFEVIGLADGYCYPWECDK